MLARQLTILARGYRHSLPVISRVRTLSTNTSKVGDTEAGKAAGKAVTGFLDMNITDVHHKANIALAVTTPIAFVLSPSMLNYPIDIALGFIIPVHSGVSMTMVAQDYVPRGTARSAAKVLICLLTFVTGYGLMKVNMCGPGITESVKSLWRKPAAKEE
mmetsp:Transcript_23943/g.42417  ORF Transcript_23943/g.42417 Transcript_23943/m.42417 type:complete len:159 (+) Transcript_23943:107-583(+)